MKRNGKFNELFYIKVSVPKSKISVIFGLIGL